jgi:hypothetical protein
MSWSGSQDYANLIAGQPIDPVRPVGEPLTTAAAQY